MAALERDSFEDSCDCERVKPTVFATQPLRLLRIEFLKLKVFWSRTSKAIAATWLGFNKWYAISRYEFLLFDACSAIFLWSHVKMPSYNVLFHFNTIRVMFLWKIHRYSIFISIGAKIFTVHVYFCLHERRLKWIFCKIIFLTQALQVYNNLNVFS